MNRIFLPLYLILFSFIIFFAPINEFALNTFFQKQWEKDVAADYQGFYVILEQLFEHVPPEEWNSTVVKASQNTNIPLEIISLDKLSLSPPQIKKLTQGGIVVADVDDDILYKRLKNSSYVIRSGPMHTDMELELGNILTAFSTFLIFFFLILAWAINLQRKMAGLNRATLSFSHGNYNTRASEGWFQQVGGLNKSFNHMAAQIQKHIQGQKELTNAVAHELRTPIACMRFELEQLESEKQPELQQQCINDIAEDIDKMDDLVEELLTYARFDHHDLPAHCETLNFNQWLNEHVEQSRFPRTIKCTFIDSPTPYRFTFEPRFMERAINNLISNAARYADSKIQVSIAPISADCFWLHIDDDGPGIPLDDREDLFSPFVRADKSRARKTGGFGLGLAIVHKIVTWHGGEVRIDDAPLGGARLSLKLKSEK